MHNRGNILDLILTNSEELVHNLSVLADIPQITSKDFAISVSFALTTGVSKNLLLSGHMTIPKVILRAFVIICLMLILDVALNLTT